MNPASFPTAFAWNSAQAAVLVPVILAVQRLLRSRLTPGWRCGLWLLVVARLALPVSLPSRVSLFNWVPVREHIPASRSHSAPPGETSTVIPEPKVWVQGLDPFPGNHHERDAAQPSSPLAPSHTIASPYGSQDQANKMDPWSMILWSWLGVSLLLAATVLRTAWRFWRRVRFLQPLENVPAVALWADCCRQLGVRRPPPVYELDGLAGPALYGCFRSRLLLPAGFISRFSQRDLRHVFLHESSHLKRRDLWWNWLATGLLILHWFNPLLWLGFARWRADRELACDARAMEAAGEGAQRGYGETILHLLEDFAPGSSGPALVGILEDKAQLRRRLEMIGAFRPGRRTSGMVLVLMVVLTVVCLTDSQEPAKPPTPAASPISNGKVLPGFTAHIAHVEQITNPELGLVILDKGSVHGMFERATLDVKRDGKVIAKVTVRDVESHAAVADIIHGTDSDPIRVGDLAVAFADPLQKDAGGPAPAPGITVHGLVMDEKGQPIPAAQVRETWSEGGTSRISTTTTGPDGRFAASHAAAARWYYTASAEGHATALAVIDGKAVASEIRIVLPPEKPLKIWVTDGGGAPLPGASVRVSRAGNEGWTFDWEAKTDQQGLVTWKQRPLAPLTLEARKDVCARFDVAPDDSEKHILLYPMYDGNRVYMRSETRTVSPVLRYVPPKLKVEPKKETQK